MRLIRAAAADGAGRRGRADPLRQNRAALDRGVGQEDRELFAADARGDVTSFDAFANDLRDRAEHLVAEQVAVGVVQLLEVIDVGEQHDAAVQRAHILDEGLHALFQSRVD